MKQYRVYLTCTVSKVITCEGCTEEQVAADPFAYAIDEIETDQHDWKVERVLADEPS